MIVFIHLLNDYSGSPRVLRQAISALAGWPGGRRLYAGSGGAGFLDSSGIGIRRYWYRRTRWRLMTLMTYLASQLLLYRQLNRARDIPADAVVYVNTLLPFGAALWGKRNRRRVVYHLHEVSVSPPLLRWFLTAIAARTASQLVYVSEDHRRRLPIAGVPAVTLPNSIDTRLFEQGAVAVYQPRRQGVFTVLMLASLRTYKGIGEFTALAAGLVERSDIRFVLVLNEDEATAEDHVANTPPPSNLAVHSRTDDPARFYADASLLLNLSLPDLWVETFGLSLVEAMAFGVPVIAPPVGGPTEIVNDGIEGFLVDSRNAETLGMKVVQLADDNALCLRMSAAARERAKDYVPERFAERLQHMIQRVAAAGEPA